MEEHGVQDGNVDTRIWMYRGTEAELFSSPEAVPKGEGWARRPGAEPEKAAAKGDVEVAEPEKVEEAPKAKRKYNRKK